MKNIFSKNKKKGGKISVEKANLFRFVHTNSTKCYCGDKFMTKLRPNSQELNGKYDKRTKKGFMFSLYHITVIMVII